MEEYETVQITSQADFIPYGHYGRLLNTKGGGKLEVVICREEHPDISAGLRKLGRH